jgi:hypothetical protein
MLAPLCNNKMQQHHSHIISINDAYAQASVATACQLDESSPSGLRQILWDNTCHLDLSLQQPQR